MIGFKIFDIFKEYLEYGFVFSGGIENNICFDPVTKNGDLVGGVPTPDTTAGGTQIYGVTFNVVTGEIIARFGAAGNEQLDNTMQLYYRFDGVDNVELFWDDVNLYYVGINLTIATYLDSEVGNTVCFLALAIPDLLIHYDFTMEVE